MANVLSVHSVGNSLAQYLENTYPDALRALFSCDFQVVASGDLEADPDFGTALTIYLYRVVINEFLRSQTSQGRPAGSRVPLTVDLHFMLTVWASSAAAEHTICTWAMHELNEHPILDVSSLTPDGGWDASEIVHIVPAELSNEDLMRIWDALAPTYRLSTSYIARSIRIDSDDVGGDLPVVANRLRYTNIAEETLVP